MEIEDPNFPPFVAIGNDELEKMPPAEPGQRIKCGKCKGTHRLERSKNSKGQLTSNLLFYVCGDEPYLGALHGKLLVPHFEQRRKKAN